MRSILVIILFVCSQLNAQTIEKFSINSGSSYFSDSNTQVLYTIGEVNIQEFSAGNIQVSEGFINSDNPGTFSTNNHLINQIVLYPNPTSKYINIKSEVAITKIEVYNLLGKKILSANSQNKINVGRFQSGIYLIKVFSEKGKTTKRFIIN